MATLRDLLQETDSFRIMPLEPGTDEQIMQAEEGNELARQRISAESATAMAQRDREAETRLKMEDELIHGLQNGNPYAIAEMQRRAQARQAKQLNFKMLIDLAKGDPDTASALLEKIAGIPRGKTREQRIEDEARIKARVGKEEAATAYLDAPASKPELENFVDPETLSPYPFGTTRRQLKGAINVSQKQRRTLTELDESRALLGEVTGITDRLITAESGDEGILEGTKLLAQSYVPGTLAKTYADKKQAFLGVLSRTLGAEKGVLTDRDIGRISNALPTFYETRASKDFKNRTLDLILETAVDARQRAIFGGKPKVDHRTKLNELLDQLEAKQPERKQLKSGKWAVKVGDKWKVEE